MKWLSLPLVLILAGIASAEPARPADKAPRKETVEEARARQEKMARMLKDVEAALLRLAQRLEKSDKPVDKQKAAAIRKALDFAMKEGMDTRMDRLREMLKLDPLLTRATVEEALAQNKVIKEDIQAMLRILLGEMDRKAIDLASLGELMKDLDRIIRAEKVVQAKLGRLDADRDALAGDQKKIAADTEKLKKDLAKILDRDQLPEKPLDDAIGKEKDAEKDINADKLPAAGDDADEAIGELERVRGLLGRIRDQEREDEIKRRLETLLARCEKMLAMQTEVFEGTKKLEAVINANDDRKPTRGNLTQGLRLADREGEIGKLGADAIKVLEEDGTVIAFLEVFKQVRADIGIVEKRLGRTDTGTVTQAIEKDIIDTLKEIIEALKKAQKPEACTKCEPPENPPHPGPYPDKPPLVDMIQELKMLRAMQNRVNTRTKTYGDLYKGEQAEAADIVKELKNLGERQLKVLEVTKGFQKTQQER